MIFPAEVEYLLLDLRRCTTGDVYRARFTIDQAGLTLLFIGLFPYIKNRSGNPKISTGFGNMTYVHSMLYNFQFPLDVSFFCNSLMIMSGFSQIEMSGIKPAIMFSKRCIGGHCGERGHHQDEHEGTQEVVYY